MGLLVDSVHHRPRRIHLRVKKGEILFFFFFSGGHLGPMGEVWLEGDEVKSE